MFQTERISTNRRCTDISISKSATAKKKKSHVKKCDALSLGRSTRYVMKQNEASPCRCPERPAPAGTGHGASTALECYADVASDFKRRQWFRRSGSFQRRSGSFQRKLRNVLRHLPGTRSSNPLQKAQAFIIRLVKMIILYNFQLIFKASAFQSAPAQLP